MSSSYSAPDGYIQSVTFAVDPKHPKTSPPAWTDPIRSFEGTGKDMGDLYNWSTVSSDKKKEFVKKFKDLPSDRNEDCEMLTWKRWRTLNFIVQEESRSATPNVEVATAAFKYLFGLDKKG
jgi:hypothetical protein